VGGVGGILGAEVGAGLPTLLGEDAMAVSRGRFRPGGVVGVLGQLFAAELVSVESHIVARIAWRRTASVLPGPWRSLLLNE
jgi:hypothetical protein